jgi:methionine-rich copper-binding protein CopC
MNRTIFAFSLMLMAVCAMAQAPAASNHAAIEKQIVASERAINDAVAKGDMKAFHAQIAADAFGIDPGGITKVSGPDFDKMLLATKIQSWNMDGSQFYWVNDNTVVHMYRWTGKGSYEGQPIPSPTWASTVWSNKGGKWMAVFHQETTAMPAAPAKK